MLLLQPLRSAPVALLWGGLTFSALGDQLYAVALTWIAVGVLGSAAGYLTALQAAVILLSVLGIGRWADAWDHRRSMIGADLVRAAILAAIVAVWLATGGPSAAGLVAAVVVLAMGQSVFQPALQAVLPGLIRDPRLLPAANALLDTTDRSARLIGPGAVALLAGLLPVVHFLSLDAVSFLGSAAAVALIRRLRPLPQQPRPTGRQAVWSAILRGVRAMRGHPLLGFVLATTAIANGTWYAVFFLGLPLMIAHGGSDGGIGAYGAVISAYGCTNLASTLCFGARGLGPRPQRQMFSGSMLVGFGMSLLACMSLLPPHWQVQGFMAAAALGAIGGPMKDIPVAVLRQTRLPLADMPAAMRAYMAANNAGLLVAMLAMPLVITWLGVFWVVLGCGAISMLVGLRGLLRFGNWIESPLREVGLA